MKQGVGVRAAATARALRNVVASLFGRRAAERIVRSRRAKGGVATGLVLMMLGAAVGIVAADAPDPDPSKPVIAASAVLNADNSTTVTLTGNWYWPTHRSDCNTNRYAVGWAIDWNDPVQPGNPIGQVNGQGPVIDVGTAAANQYNPADNNTHFYNGPNPPRCGVYDPAVGYNRGTWGPISHTYAPNTLPSSPPCVVTYDIHGKTSPNSADLLAGGPDRAKDNSVEKNGSTPAGNGCYANSLNPDLKIVKSASQSQVTVNTPFTYSLVASNTGIISVAQPVVTDTLPADITISNLDSRCTQAALVITCKLAQLNPGASAPAITMTAVSSKVGTYENTAVITPNDDTPDDNTSKTTVTVVDTPVQQLTIALDKKNDANQDGTYNDSETAKTVGQNVSFQLKVTNSSAVDVVVDSISDAYGNTTITPTCTPNIVGTTLTKNGGSATCTFNVDNYGPAAGVKLTDTATVKVHDATRPTNTATATDTSDVTGPTLGTLSLKVDKTNDANQDNTFSDLESAKTVGQDVKFQAVVTNTSAVAVVVDSLKDEWPNMPANTNITFTPALVGQTLAAGASQTVTFTVPNYGPAKGSTVTDTVTVTGHQSNVPSNTVTGSDTSTVAGPGTVIVDIEKTNNADQTGSFSKVETAKTAGQDVDFQLKITNPSTVAVDITSLTDAWDGHADGPLPTGSACAALVGTSLNPGQSKTCTFTEKGYAPAEGAAAINNVATVVVAESGNSGNTATANDDSTVQAPPLPALSLNVQKTNDANGDGTFSDGETGKTVGGSVTFQVAVTNTSAVPVVVASLTDAWPGHADAAVDSSSSCAALVGTTIAAGASKTCTFSEDNYVPAEGASVINTVTVKVNEPNNPGNSTTGTDTSTVTGPNTPVLSLDVVKLNDGNNDGTYTDNETAPAVGSAVKFQVTVKNTSSVAVTINTITDEWPGRAPFSLANSCPSLIGRVLQPGDTTGPQECQWTETNYSPPVGNTLVNTVKVNGVQAGSSNNSVAGNDTTAVQSAAQVLPAVITNPPATPAAVALPKTGRNSFLLMLFGGLLFLAGAFLIAGSEPLISRRFRRMFQM
jgi:uncharacterized repeat protein (TIGR01451 family)